MIEVAVGAIIMLVGVLVGFGVVSAGRNSDTLSKTEVSNSPENFQILDFPVDLKGDIPTISPKEVKDSLNDILTKLRNPNSIGSDAAGKDNLLDEIDEEVAVLVDKL